jgi:hypothetical protein
VLIGPRLVLLPSWQSHHHPDTRDPADRRRYTPALYLRKGAAQNLLFHDVVSSTWNCWIRRRRSLPCRCWQRYRGDSDLGSRYQTSAGKASMMERYETGIMNRRRSCAWGTCTHVSSGRNLLGCAMAYEAGIAYPLSAPAALAFTTI